MVDWEKVANTDFLTFVDEGDVSMGTQDDYRAEGQAVGRAATDSWEWAEDAVSDAVSSVLPWWWPYAVAGGVSLVALIVLRPYASLGASVIG